MGLSARIPRNTYFHGGGDHHDIGAAYAFHLAESQGFLDGNKRTAIACAGTFLRANGWVDRAQDLALYDAMIYIYNRGMNDYTTPLTELGQQLQTAIRARQKVGLCF